MQNGPAPIWRADILRRIAALRAEVDRMLEASKRHRIDTKKLRQLNEQIADLWKQFDG
jgi:hypothetical protein